MFSNVFVFTRSLSVAKLHGSRLARNHVQNSAAPVVASRRSFDFLDLKEISISEYSDDSIFVIRSYARRSVLNPFQSITNRSNTPNFRLKSKLGSVSRFCALSNHECVQNINLCGPSCSLEKFFEFGSFAEHRQIEGQLQMPRCPSGASGSSSN